MLIERFILLDGFVSSCVEKFLVLSPKSSPKPARDPPPEWNDPANLSTILMTALISLTDSAKDFGDAA